MTKKYLIRFWHGKITEFRHFHDKINEMCPPVEGFQDLVWNGDLAEFAEKWQDKFIFFPPLEREKPRIDGTIWITPYSSFNTQ